MFRTAYILVAIWASTYAIPALERSPLPWNERIVGGSNAKDGEAPYQVSLRWTLVPEYHFCGASIISSRWILCAAHCTTGISPSNALAVVGSVLNNPIGKTYKIVKIINHAAYNSKNIVNDISLLQTIEDITFGDSVQSIPLTSRTVGGNELAILTGWGQLSVSFF
jgi:secreted trypsin-like serine protease